MSNKEPQKGEGLEGDLEAGGGMRDREMPSGVVGLTARMELSSSRGSHGRDYTIEAPGSKYNMTDIAAAIGIHQLRRADSTGPLELAVADKES